MRIPNDLRQALRAYVEQHNSTLLGSVRERVVKDAISKLAKEPRRGSALRLAYMEHKQGEKLIARARAKFQRHGLDYWGVRVTDADRFRKAGGVLPAMKQRITYTALVTDLMRADDAAGLLILKQHGILWAFDKAKAAR